MNYTLKVFISCRDRTHLTQKCIESIHQGCTVFNDIKIYLFDNLSVVTEERLNMIKHLLDNNLIHYYSYDTDESLTSCFGKVMCFQRWIKMMKVQEFLHSQENVKNLKRNRNFIEPPKKIENLYYMLVDNDMMFRKGWDTYFISAADSAIDTVHFLVPWPGGCPGAEKRTLKSQVIKNKFTNETVETYYDFLGGASGMWFMSPKMLPKLLWDDSDLLGVYKRFKRHDSLTWRIINRKSKGSRTLYVMRVKPPDMDNPFLIHLGGVFGSLCNNLTKKSFNEEMQKSFEKNDNDVKDLSVSEIFDKYKIQGRIW